MRPACMEMLPVEVLDIVLDFLARDGNIYTNLASAMRVNRLWYDIAADYLWESVDLLAVLRLLPDDAWCFREGNESVFDETRPASAGSERRQDDAAIPTVIKSWKAACDLTNPVFVLLRGIEPSEWENIMHYTSRIKTLLTAAYKCTDLRPRVFDVLSTDVRREGRMRSFPSIYDMILLSPPQTRLFPRLRSLCAADAIVRYAAILRVFASNHLRSVNVATREWVSPHIMTWLSSAAPTLTGTLEYLHITAIGALILATYHGLRNVVLHTVASDVWDALSTLPLLRTLRVYGICGMGGLCLSDSTGSLPGKVSFPALEGLSLAVRKSPQADSADAIAILDTLSNKAQLKQLSITYKYDLLYECDPVSEPKDTVTIGSDVRLLVAFCGLQTMMLDAQRAFNATEVDLMARSWPLLEQLYLPSFALGGLAPLAMHCPRLSHLCAGISDVDRAQQAWIDRDRAAQTPISETLVAVHLKLDGYTLVQQDFCRLCTNEFFPNAVHEPEYSMMYFACYYI
ncbi:hypothetical protein BD626DRAFT_636141 [Schizophyllum amplum]|uniref:F-box domain-containing protein n=1 Tax=Schizophyllum amplum TaxID=97359 RepID=A0A550BTS0_9AGAR|nr:hypothetical protein BD626DRAFT_636141 [Auriculariopsis ampla]